MRWLMGLLLLAAMGDVHALRCGGRIISNGDHAYTVRERCGDPFWVEDYSEVLVAGENTGLEQRIEHKVQAWYYNFGPNKLMRRLLMRGNRLVRDDTLGYGYREFGTRCDPDALVSGISTGEVIARCGLPASRDVTYAERVVRNDLGQARRRIIRRDEWVYDNRANRAPRLLTFDDGRLVGRERLR